jgi:hypothetical protein
MQRMLHPTPVNTKRTWKWVVSDGELPIDISFLPGSGMEVATWVFETYTRIRISKEHFPPRITLDCKVRLDIYFKNRTLHKCMK